MGAKELVVRKIVPSSPPALAVSSSLSIPTLSDLLQLEDSDTFSVTMTHKLIPLV